MIRLTKRVAGEGRLALIGGGEFSFGETVEADLMWVERTPDGAIGFVPTASGSTDYGMHLAGYLSEAHGREVETVPIYRGRDARRAKNLERLRSCAGLYLGGGLGDQLLEVLRDSPALEAMEDALKTGSTVVAIASAAQAAGTWMRSLRGREQIPALGWLRETVVEANFLPTHDHRLRRLLGKPGATYGLGLPAGSCFMISEAGVEMHGPIFVLEDSDADLKLLNNDEPTSD